MESYLGSSVGHLVKECVQIYDADINAKQFLLQMQKNMLQNIIDICICFGDSLSHQLPYHFSFRGWDNYRLIRMDGNPVNKSTMCDMFASKLVL